MRLSEKTPMMAVLFLILAVAVGLGFWYIDVREQTQTQHALEQTRDAFERLERERKAPGDPTSAPASASTTPIAADAATGPLTASPAAAEATQRSTASAALQGTPAAKSSGSRDVDYLFAALLLTALIALALAGSSYRLVQKERRARMANDRLERESASGRSPLFRTTDVTIIDAEPLETVTADGTPMYSPDPPAIDRSSDHLSDWLQQSPLAVLMMLPSGEVRILNAAFTRLTGYTTRDLPNMQSWLARGLRVATDRQDAARDALRERYARAAEAPTETVVWTRAGEPRHWLLHTMRARIDGEEMWLLTGTDISDRRQAEHAALERAKSARNEAVDLGGVYQAAPVGLAVLDTQLRFVRVNDRLAAMNGLRAEDHIGRPLRKLLPHVAATAEPLLEQALQTGAASPTARIGVRTPANPKVEQQWTVSCAPVKDAEGRVTRIAFAADDVSDHHQAEAATRESERGLRTILEHLPAAVCVKDNQGRYIYANPQYEAFVHAAPGQLTGRMDHEVLAWEAADKLREYDDEALTAAKVMDLQGSAPFADGLVFYTASKIALRDPHGRPYAVCSIYSDVTARQQAETDMRTSEARYRAIFETSPQPLFIDRDNKLAYVNPACVRLLAARDRQQLLGKSILEFIQQPWHKAFQERIQRALRRKPVTCPLEVKLVRLDGSVMEVEIEAALYETPGERAVQILVRDVTERKRADENLRESEARTRIAAEEAPVLIRVADADGNTTYWNAQWQRHTGLSANQALGLRWLGSVHPDDRERIEAALLAARTQRDPVHVEYRLREREGSYRSVLDVAMPRHDEAGAYLGYVSCITDITERKRIEDQLQQDAARFRSAAELAPALLWIEAGERCEFANTALREYLGLPSGGGASAADWMSRIHPEDQPAYEVWRRAVGAGAARHAQMRVQRADGEYRWVVASMAPRIGDEGELAGWVGALVDVTDMRRVELALRDTDQRRNAFVAALATEMRASLEPLRHAAEVLGMLSVQEPRAREASDIVVRQAQYLARLLEGARDLSHLLERPLVLEPSVAEIGTLVHQAADAARPLVEARGQSLTLTLPAGRARVHVDADRLTQAMTALLDYSARCSSKGSELAVRAEEGDRQVVLLFRAGCLAPPGTEADSLFELFPSGSCAASTARGIALPLVRQLIELQGGTIDARSGSEGTEFVLRLPVYDATAEAAVHATGKTANSHRRVLVVERDPDAAASLRMLLQLQGHDVKVATDRASALPAAQEFHPDTVLIDSGTQPDGSEELVRALRMLPETAHAALLGLMAGETAQEGLFDHCLMKPVEPHLLQQVLAQTSPTLH